MTRALNALPRSLRWVLFLPLGLLGSLVVYTIVTLIVDIGGLPNTPQTPDGMVRTGIIRFFVGLTATLFPAKLSPKPWPIGVAIFVVGVLMAISPIVIGIVMNAPLSDFRLPVQDLATSTAGAGLALFLITQPAAGRVSSL